MILYITASFIVHLPSSCVFAFIPPECVLSKNILLSLNLKTVPFSYSSFHNQLQVRNVWSLAVSFSVNWINCNKASTWFSLIFPDTTGIREAEEGSFGKRCELGFRWRRLLQVAKHGPQVEFEIPAGPAGLSVENLACAAAQSHEFVVILAISVTPHVLPIHNSSRFAPIISLLPPLDQTA